MFDHIQEEAVLCYTYLLVVLQNVFLNSHRAGQVRHGPIMLFKLPIMLLSNAPNFSLLCLNYAPFCPIMLQYAL